MIDEFNREALRIEVDTTLPAARVFRALTEMVEMHDLHAGRVVAVAQEDAAAGSGAWPRGFSAGVGACGGGSDPSNRSSQAWHSHFLALCL